MAKTWTQIEMQYERALAQADTLEQLAGQLKAHAQHVRETLQALPAAWCGAPADAWLQKARPVSHALRQSADALAKEAGALKKRARAVRDAERAALLAAQIRTD